MKHTLYYILPIALILLTSCGSKKSQQKPTVLYLWKSQVGKVISTLTRQRQKS